MKSTTKKLLLGVLMTVCLAVLMAVCAGAEDVTYSEGLEFTSNGDGTCSVSGIGTCTDTEIMIPPVSPEGDAVTEIGANAFKGNKNITSVQMPNSITKIGANSFLSCKKLTRVNIPENVTNIGNSAFKTCDQLSIISFDAIAMNDITNSRNSVFYNAGMAGDGITVVVGSSVTKIPKRLFYPWEPNVGIGEPIVYYPPKITSVVFEEKSKCASIGERAFCACSALSSINIPESVTSIGQSAFYRTGLTNIYIPASVTNISGNVFNACTELSSITVSSDNSVYHSAGNCLIQTASKKLIAGCKNSVIPDDGSVTIIGGNSFSGQLGLTSITIPERIEQIESWAFSGCTGLKEINYFATSVEDMTGYTWIFNGCGSDGSGIKFVIGANVIKIPSRLMTGAGDCKIISVEFEQGSVCESIGESAFSGLSYLTKINIPDSVIFIREYAFSECYRLKSITLPEKLKRIGKFAFRNCYDLEEIRYNAISLTNLEYNSNVFHEAGKNGEGITIIVDKNVKSIPNYLFYNSSSGCEYYECKHSPAKLRSLNFESDSVCSSIGISAFSGCIGLTEISFPNSLTNIGKEAFNDCDELTCITISQNVEKIGDFAFAFCPNLSYISVHEDNGVYRSEGNCLIHSETKTLIVGCQNSVIPTDGSVTIIGARAFSGSSNLENIGIPSSITRIGEYAFWNCDSLKNVLFNTNSNLLQIDSFAFYNCKQLTSFVIPEKVNKIGNSIFSGCDNLKILCVEEGNEVFHSNGNCIIDTANKALVMGCATSVIPADGSVTWIRPYAFHSCRGLKFVNIPNSVYYIGESAFSSSGLQRVYLPTSVTHIETWAFDYCYAITDVYYGGSLEQWDAIKIGNCNSYLKNATIHFFGEPIETKITGASLSLGQSLAMNYYAVLIPNHTTAQMRFTYHGETIVVNGVIGTETGEYIFTLNRISPQCMADDIKAELILVAADGTETILAVKESYSIRQYCDDALKSDSENEVLGTLLADLLAYGAAAQKYANYKEDALVNEGFPIAPSDWENVTETDYVNVYPGRDDLCFIAAGVRFGYVNRLYFKIKADDLVLANSTNGSQLVKEDDGTYILYTSALYATEFDDVIVAFTFANGKMVQAVEYSVKSYVYAKQDGNDDMAALARALYQYGRSAITYQNTL